MHMVMKQLNMNRVLAPDPAAVNIITGTGSTGKSIRISRGLRSTSGGGSGLGI